MTGTARPNFVAVEARLTAAEAEAAEATLPLFRQLVERGVVSCRGKHPEMVCSALTKLHQAIWIMQEPFEGPSPVYA